MKKYIGLLSIMAVALLGACSKEAPFDNPNDGLVGYLAPEALSVSVNNEEKLVRADITLPDVSDFTIVITKVGETKPALTSQLSRISEVIALPVGDYTVTARYGNNDPAAFEAPYFLGVSEQFSIEADKITSNIEPIVCKLANVKVTVQFGPDLIEAMSDDSKVSVKVGESGILDFTFADNDRSGYFAYVENSQTLVATFTGTIQNSETVQTKAHNDVAPGNHYHLYFEYYKVNPDDPGNISSEITINATVESEDLNSEVDAPEDEILTDDKRPQEGNVTPGPDTPGVNTPPTLTVNKPFSLEEGAVNDVSSFNPKTEDNPGGTDILELTATSTTGITKFIVRIESEQLTADELEGFGLKQNLDLISPGTTKAGLVGLGFPVEDQVENKKSVTASITKFIPLLAVLGPGVHKFVVTVGDVNGDTVKTLTLEVK